MLLYRNWGPGVLLFLLYLIIVLKTKGCISSFFASGHQSTTLSRWRFERAHDQLCLRSSRSQVCRADDPTRHWTGFATKHHGSGYADHDLCEFKQWGEGIGHEIEDWLCLWAANKNDGGSFGRFFQCSTVFVEVKVGHGWRESVCDCRALGGENVGNIIGGVKRSLLEPLP